MPCDDIVKARENAAMDTLPSRQRLKELSQSSSGIRTDMGNESVAEVVGQIIHQWDVAKAVLVAPKDAVGLEWVVAIRDKDDVTPDSLIEAIITSRPEKE